MRNDPGERGYVFSWVLFALILAVLLLAAGLLYLVVATAPAGARHPPRSALPFGTHGDRAEKPDEAHPPLIAGLDAEGRVFLDDRPVTLDELADGARRHRFRFDPEHGRDCGAVYVRLHARARWQHASWLLATLARAGVRGVRVRVRIGNDATATEASLPLALGAEPDARSEPGPAGRRRVRVRAHGAGRYSLDGIEADSAQKIAMWVGRTAAADCTRAVFVALDGGRDTPVQAVVELLDALTAWEVRAATEPPPDAARTARRLPGPT